MMNYIWLLYNEGEVPEQVLYWVDTWEDLIDNCNKNPYGLELFNVHFFIRSIGVAPQVQLPALAVERIGIQPGFGA